MSRAAQYVELADRLEVRWSVLAPGTLVESEHQLAAEFSVNRLTAREAVRELERRMVVRRVMGRGTYTSLRVDYRIKLGEVASFHRTVEGLGLDATIDVIGFGWSGRGSHRRLEVRRTGSVAGFPATSFTEVFPAEAGRRVEAAVAGGGSVHEALETAGYVPRRRSVHVAMDVPPADAAEALGFAAAVPPSWRVRSVTVDHATGLEIHRSDTWMRTDTFAVSVELADPAYAPS